MSDESTLYEQANSDPVKGYVLLKSNGGNVPTDWVNRYTEIRKKKQNHLAKALKEGLKSYATLLEWEEAFKEVCFYYGICTLFELERTGKTDY